MKRFIPALDMLRRAPEKMLREDFAEIYISREDDRAMFHQVKSSMSEVYDLMSIQMTKIERQSTMGLIHDVMMFAIRKDQQVFASKVYSTINDVPTMMEHDDVSKVFDTWEDTMTEVQHSGMITDEMIVQSMHTMMARFQPRHSASSTTSTLPETLNFTSSRVRRQSTGPDEESLVWATRGSNGAPLLIGGTYDQYLLAPERTKPETLNFVSSRSSKFATLF